VPTFDHAGTALVALDLIIQTQIRRIKVNEPAVNFLNGLTPNVETIQRQFSTSEHLPYGSHHHQR